MGASYTWDIWNRNKNKHNENNGEKPNTVPSCLVLSCLVLSCLVLSCLVLTRLVLSCLFVTCLVFPCLPLSCSCLVLLIDLIARCFSMIPWAAPYPTRFGEEDGMREDEMKRECWCSFQNREEDEDERGSHRLVSCMCSVVEVKRTKEQKNKRTKEQKNKRTKEQKNKRTKEQKNKRTKEQKNKRTKEQNNKRTKEQKNKRTKEQKNKRTKEHKTREIFAVAEMINGVHEEKRGCPCLFVFGQHERNMRSLISFDSNAKINGTTKDHSFRFRYPPSSHIPHFPLRAGMLTIWQWIRP